MTPPRKERRLTYLASWDADSATVGLETVGVDHPAATTFETENLFSFTTERYSERPLVIRGPAPGPRSPQPGSSRTYWPAVSVGVPSGLEEH